MLKQKWMGLALAASITMAPAAMAQSLPANQPTNSSMMNQYGWSDSSTRTQMTAPGTVNSQGSYYESQTTGTYGMQPGSQMSTQQNMNAPMTSTYTQIERSQVVIAPIQQMYTLPAGTQLSIRETGDPAVMGGSAFSGELVNPVRIDGQVVIPAGSTVTGQLVSADEASDLRTIRLTNISTPQGQIAMNADVDTDMPFRVSAVREDQPLSGQVTRQDVGTFVPRVTWLGDRDMSPAGRILTGTVGGAAFGAATGPLIGITMLATDKNNLGISSGSAAARGVAWGAAYGAGFGLLGGLISAATADKPAAVSAVRTGPSTAYRSGDVFTVTLDEPVTFSL